jgi:hypothetical protein
MDEKDHEIAHFRIVARNRKLAEIRANWQFATDWLFFTVFWGFLRPKLRPSYK